MKRKDGYVVDTSYPVFFYKEMQPIWLNTVVQFLGFKTPNIHQKFSYLELACATGVNLLIAAMNHPHGDFVGVDFNPQHIESARKSAQKLDLKNIEFIHADFSEFLRSNTQQFDFIVNHGTFTWISPEHQQQVLYIIDKFLNASGICYLHYMCYPGSKDLIPLQKLLNLVDQQDQESSIVSIETGKQLFYDLNQAGAFVNQTKIDAVLNTLKNNHTYLAHEFLTDHWKPLFSVDLHQMVYEKTKMTYLGSANPCENLESISIPANMQQKIRETSSPKIREYLKDLARDAKQRIDLFQKKTEVLNSLVHMTQINQIQFKLLPKAPMNGIEKFNTAIGAIQAPQDLIKAMFENLAKQDLTFAAFMADPLFQNNPIFLIETLFLLMNEGYIHPVTEQMKDLDRDLIQKFNKMMASEKINLKILENCGIAI